MWQFRQSDGQISHNGQVFGFGYSGHGPGVNNPSMEATPMVGPLPRGRWCISGFYDDPHGKGPIVARLIPADGTETFGRSGFMIHGDNKFNNKSASEGCVVASRVIRMAMRDSQDHDLEVV